MKKTKVIIPALGILLLSTAASVTGTVAWFSMNTNVSATGMQLKAEAENGIVISNEAKSEWKASASASHVPASDQGFVPTSTADTVTWYHANSDDLNNHAAVGGYTTPAISSLVGEEETGIGKAGDKAYYLVNKFYIKSANATPLENIDFYINTVTAAPGTGSAELDVALRVAVVIGSNVKIYAPIKNATLNYTVGGSTAVQAINSSENAKVNTKLTGITIPANSSGTPLEASIFCYFEGEDEHCKSINITSSLDNLAVSVQFGTVAVA